MGEDGIFRKGYLGVVAPHCQSAITFLLQTSLRSEERAKLPSCLPLFLAGQGTCVAAAAAATAPFLQPSPLTTDQHFSKDPPALWG